MITALSKRNVETSLPRYKFLEWYFIDQFWNKVKWVQCPCWKLWLEQKFKYFTNYWWAIIKKYACNQCLANWWENDRVNRIKSRIWKITFWRRTYY